MSRITNLLLSTGFVPLVAFGSVPPGAAELGYSECVIDESPAVRDIAPGNSGNYKWFSGPWWSTKPASQEYYTNGEGVLTLHQKGDGITPSLVSRARDFSSGMLPVLPGKDGFYVEFEVRISENDLDHWPAVWLMPIEHYSKNSENESYPDDPPGFKRWMELDVDEGGFGVGFLGSVISWTGKWPDLNRELCNSWGETIETPLDRTQWHTFGASYDPASSSVSWWLDGIKVYTVQGGCVPDIAKDQNFYVIFGAQTHGKNLPYTMDVRRVRAFVLPSES